jgi:hypothetical protein
VIQIGVQILPFPLQNLQLVCAVVIVDVANVGRRASVEGRVLSEGPFGDIKIEKLGDWIE